MLYYIVLYNRFKMRTGPTNPILQNIITELKKRAKEQNAPLWKRVADELERATRQRRVVNLSRLNRYTKENEVIIVPGKVLGSGRLEHKLTISAFQISESARKKLEEIGGKIISLLEISKENPKGRRIRIIG
jgi:large subunit ribosomal protein L18e